MTAMAAAFARFFTFGETLFVSISILVYLWEVLVVPDSGARQRRVPTGKVFWKNTGAERG
jgi:hypothetical protein